MSKKQALASRKYCCVSNRSRCFIIWIFGWRFGKHAYAAWLGWLRTLRRQSQQSCALWRAMQRWPR
jgi:hypothetical protein